MMCFNFSHASLCSSHCQLWRRQWRNADCHWISRRIGLSSSYAANMVCFLFLCSLIGQVGSTFVLADETVKSMPYYEYLNDFTLCLVSLFKEMLRNKQIAVECPHVNLVYQPNMAIYWNYIRGGFIYELTQSWPWHMGKFVVYSIPFFLLLSLNLSIATWWSACSL